MVETSKSLPHRAGLHKGKRRGKKEWNHTVHVSYIKSVTAWKQWKATGSPKEDCEIRQTYIASKRQFRAALRQSRATAQLQHIENIEKAKHSDDKLFYQLINTSSKGSSAPPLKNLTYKGSTYDGNEMIIGWETYFRDLSTPQTEITLETQSLKTTPPTNCNPPTPSQMCKPQMAPPQPFTSQDLLQAIKHLKTGKSAGHDDISPEHVKHLGDNARSLLLWAYNTCTQLVHVPSSWKSGIIIPLYKGKNKDPNNPSNYRGITLTSTLAKLLELLLKPRLEEHLHDQEIPDELQMGFQEGRSCTITSCCLELIIESNACTKKATYAALLDAEKAFDKVRHEGLFQKLQTANTETAYLRLLMDFYTDANSKVMWDGTLSNSIQLSQGVRQGSVLSPMLYNVYIDGLIKRLKAQGLGCNFNGRYAGVLALADDIALLSNSSEELQQMLDTTHQYTQEWKYKINTSKSAILVFNSRYDKSSTQTSWKLGEGSIEKTVKHPHLGISKSSTNVDITSDMISRGYRSFFALRGSGAHLNGTLPNICAHLWKIFCIPRMLYGAPIYRLTKTKRLKLDKAQTHLFKKILGLPQQAADAAVYLLTGLIPLSFQIDIDTLLLVGQICSLPQERYEKRTLMEAASLSTPMVKDWQEMLVRYNLPDIFTIMQGIIPYQSWKKQVKNTVGAKHHNNLNSSIQQMSSLSLWRNRTFLHTDIMYPKRIPQHHLRRAIIIRGQLLTNTYPLQTRLKKIQQSKEDTCNICQDGLEDTNHFISTCTGLQSHRHKLSDVINNSNLEESIKKSFQYINPTQLTSTILLLPDLPISQQDANVLNACILNYIFKIHTTRMYTTQTSGAK